MNKCKKCDMPTLSNEKLCSFHKKEKKHVILETTKKIGKKVLDIAMIIIPIAIIEHFRKRNNK